MAEDPRPAWRHELATTGAWVRRSRTTSLAGAGVGCLAFTAIGLGLLATSSTAARVVGAVAVVTFGLGFLPVVVWRAVTGKPVLRVDHGGVVLDRVAVPWSGVTGLGTGGSGRSAYVLLRLTPQAAQQAMAQRTVLGRWVQRASDRVAGGPGLGIPSGYGIPPGLLAEWLTEVAHARPGQ